MLTSDVPDPYTVLEQRSTKTPLCVLPEPILSKEDKFILYSVLQDIANEIRKIDHERQKHHQKREHVH